MAEPLQRYNTGLIFLFQHVVDELLLSWHSSAELHRIKADIWLLWCMPLIPNSIWQLDHDILQKLPHVSCYVWDSAALASTWGNNYIHGSLPCVNLDSWNNDSTTCAFSDISPGSWNNLQLNIQTLPREQLKSHFFRYFRSLCFRTLEERLLIEVALQISWYILTYLCLPFASTARQHQMPIWI